MSSVVILLWVALQPSSLVGEAGRLFEPGEVFLEANSAYASGDFAAAVAGYRSLLDADVDHGMVHYNLGNAQLRRGEVGPAIASYLRARQRAPRDQDVRANLAFARRRARDAIAPPQASVVMRTVFFWHYALNLGELTWAVIGLNALFWFVAAARLLRRGSESLLWAGSGVLLLLLALGSSLVIHRFFPQRIGVVVPLEAEARSSYGDDAVVRFKLHAGTEVRIEKVTEGWSRIVLPDGERGWIVGDSLEIVEL